MAAAVICELGITSISAGVATGRNRIGARDLASLRASFAPNLGPSSGQSQKRQEVAGNPRWQKVEQVQDNEKLSRAAKSRDLLRAQSSTSKAASITESQFDSEVLNSSMPVLVDFWASWCGPCKLMGISLDWVAEKYKGKIKCVKLESDKSERLVEKYGVYGLPTVLFFTNGEVVPKTKKEGAMSKDKLQAYIEEFLLTSVPAS